MKNKEKLSKQMDERAAQIEAINYEALNKALSNEKSRKQLEKIFSKVRY